ncbi:DivIVA domain-containing protein [Micromonospora sediminicola]|uniref:DivIVA domain-containing protein n=1 Tax=Micromonospora sediminicola TaxID=946078 RepID=UPI003F4C37EA
MDAHLFHPTRRRAPNEGWYRSVSCRPLSVGQIRERRFRTVRRGGLDPAEVHAFLCRVAGGLALARHDAARCAEENTRLKRAPRLAAPVRAGGVPVSRERFVVHLPVLAADLDGARADVERAGTTVPCEDEQSLRHWVWCDRC